MTCKNDLKFKFQYPQTKLYWNMAIPIYFMFCLWLFSQYSSRIEYAYLGWQSLKYS